MCHATRSDAQRILVIRRSGDPLLFGLSLLARGSQIFQCETLRAMHFRAPWPFGYQISAHSCWRRVSAFQRLHVCFRLGPPFRRTSSLLSSGHERRPWQSPCRPAGFAEVLNPSEPGVPTLLRPISSPFRFDFHFSILFGVRSILPGWRLLGDYFQSIHRQALVYFVFYHRLSKPNDMRSSIHVVLCFLLGLVASLALPSRRQSLTQYTLVDFSGKSVCDDGLVIFKRRELELTDERPATRS